MVTAATLTQAFSCAEHCHRASLMGVVPTEINPRCGTRCLQRVLCALCPGSPGPGTIFLRSAVQVSCEDAPCSSAAVMRARRCSVRFTVTHAAGAPWLRRSSGRVTEWPGEVSPVVIEQKQQTREQQA